MDKKVVIESKIDVDYAKKEYRTVGLAMFIVSIAVLVMRIVIYYVQIALINSTIQDYYLNLLIEAIFSVPVQVIILFLIPFIIYKTELKKSVSEVWGFSGYRWCNGWTVLLSFLLGFCIIFITMACSYLWQIILVLFGFEPSGGATPMPPSFSIIYFISSVVLTAILPALCEEFAMRGGLLTVLRANNSKAKTILLIGIAFGLFHQNISQVFYTALMGALLCYLTLETDSIWPAVVVHFTNNFMSVYIDTASTYRLPLGNIMTYIENRLVNLELGQLTTWIAFFVLAAFGLTVAIVAISRNERKSNVYALLNTAHANANVKMELRDNVFFIGAIVVSAVSTVITFIFGL
ncbi:MAG: CPBP family intramembrane metalloprotease [Clostridia bacterium]|nr:CPBP family intramembrane metalloprotease [Clostridia bacterium]